MRTHPLDSAFKDGLQGNSAQVPDGMWDSIQSQLATPKPTAKRLPFWIVGSALLITLIGAIAFWPQSTLQENPTEKEFADPEFQQTLAIASTDRDQNESIANNATQNNASPEVVPGNSDLDTDSDKNVMNAGIDSKLQESKVTNQVAHSQSSKTLSATTEASNRSNAGSTFLSENILVQSDTKEHLNKTIPIEENHSSGNPTGTTSNQNHNNKLILIEPINTTSSEVKYDSGIGLKVTDCYAFDKKTSGQFFAEVYVGPTFSIRSLSSKGESVDDYISARDSTESSQLSFHAGLRIGYEHKSGLTGRAGIVYTLVNEVFKQESKYSRTIIDSVFDTNGDLIRVDTTLETGTRVKQTQNRYHTVDIPLLIGYRIDNGNWDIGIQAGPIFNIAFNAKGDMINPTTGIVGSFSDSSDPDYHPVFKDKIGISIYASVYASKRIGDNLWAFVEPHLQYRLKSITLDSYPVEQKQTNIGLSIGLRYKF
jgi:hypothetical protein